jgi:cell division transport system permease protein
MIIMFFLSSIFFYASQGFSSVLKFYETRPEITIFLKDGLDTATIESIQKELANFAGVREIRFISKEKALKIYQEQNKENPLLTEMVTSSLLPASFEVSVNDPLVLDQISTNFKNKSTQVDEIIFQKEIIASLLKITATVRQWGIIGVSVFALISFLLVFVIIGLKTTSRKDEIKISRLLGASRFYVIRPFVFEGTIYGLLGAFVGTILASILIYLNRAAINGFFQPTLFVSDTLLPLAVLSLLNLSLGVTLGSFAAYFGSRRYIRF